jgi:hypothetical protein
MNHNSKKCAACWHTHDYEECEEYDEEECQIFGEKPWDAANAEYERSRGRLVEVYSEQGMPCQTRFKQVYDLIVGRRAERE